MKTNILGRELLIKCCSKANFSDLRLFNEHLHLAWTWILKRGERNRIQAAEIICLGLIKECSRLEKIRNNGIREELEIDNIKGKKISRYRGNWESDIMRMNVNLIPQQVC